MWAREDAVDVVLQEAGQWRQGERVPVRVLGALSERHPGPVNHVRHWSTGGCHSYSLTRDVGTAAPASRRAGRRRQDAEIDELARAVAWLGEVPADIRLPYLERPNGAGELATALDAPRERQVERDVLDRSPIGISWSTADGWWRGVDQRRFAQLPDDVTLAVLCRHPAA